MQALLDTVAADLRSQEYLPLTTIETTLQRLKDAIDISYAKPYQRYPRVRAFFVKEYGQDSREARTANIVFRMTRKQHSTAVAKSRARVLERNVKQTVLHIEFIRDVVDWLRANGSVIDKIMLLMLSCGSRRCEIMDTGRANFSAEGVPDGFIRQDGFAKKSAGSKVESVVKPLLFLTTTEFMTILHDLTAATSGLALDSNRLLSQFDDKLEILSKECFPQFVLNGFPVGTHCCRAIYVNVAFFYHHEPRESLVAFASRVLGHENLLSVPNYLHVAIAFSRDDILGKEATDQEEEARGKMAIIEVQNSEGKSFRLRPIPHRRLTKEERIVLKTNRLNDLRDKHIDASHTLLKFLKLL